MFQSVRSKVRRLSGGLKAVGNPSPVDDATQPEEESARRKCTPERPVVILAYRRHTTIIVRIGSFDVDIRASSRIGTPVLARRGWVCGRRDSQGDDSSSSQLVSTAPASPLAAAGAGPQQNCSRSAHSAEWSQQSGWAQPLQVGGRSSVSVPGELERFSMIRELGRCGITPDTSV